MKTILFNIFKKLNLLSFYSLKKSGHLHDQGWFNSFKSGRSIDKNKSSIPWMTYSFLSFIEPRLDRNFRMYEFGSGDSTKWWASRVENIVSVEHDQEWFNMTKANKAVNSQIILRSLENRSYAKSIIEFGKFDIIIVDGRDRINCTIESIKALNEKGIIIFDNSDREEYHDAYQLLSDQGFKRLDFYGLGPINVMAWSTSVFYKNENCIGL